MKNYCKRIRIDREKSVVINNIQHEYESLAQKLVASIGEKEELSEALRLLQASCMFATRAFCFDIEIPQEVKTKQPKRKPVYDNKKPYTKKPGRPNRDSNKENSPVISFKKPRRPMQTAKNDDNE